MIKKSLIKKIKKSFWGYVMVAPLMIGLAVFSIYPFFYGITLSFFDVNTSNPIWRPIGLGNYKELFSDPVFWNSCKNMLILMIPKLIIGVFVPFIYAEIIFSLRNKKNAKVYRVLMLLPIVAPGVVGLLIWKSIYAPDGLLNSFFSLFSSDKISTDWLNSDAAPYKTYLALIFLGFPWVGGTGVLIYLSGLMNISDSVFEASKIDNFSTMKRIFKIDMPLCLGQFRYFLIFGIIGGLQDYGNQIVLYKLAPDYLYVPGYYLYKQAYTNDRSGYASAIGVCLFIIIIFFTLLANYLTKREKNKGGN